MPLPLELIWQVCLLLDIASAINFSQVNRRARQIISSTRQFRQLGKYATSCLWLLLRTDLAPHIGAPALHSALTTEACTICGFFGGFILLPSAQRCCYFCMRADDSLQPEYLHILSATSKIPRQQFEMSVPIMHTIPGVYTMLERPVETRCFVVAAQHARQALREFGADVPNFFDCHVLRFMSATSLPYLDPVTEELQSGVACRGCSLGANKLGFFKEVYIERRDRLYSRRGFLLHLGSCENARDVWLER